MDTSEAGPLGAKGTLPVTARVLYTILTNDFMRYRTRLSDIIRSPEGVAIAVYFVFTIVAVIGFATFGLHPQLLAGRPALAAFYGQAFTLFAQGHVLLGALVLAVYLVRCARGRWLAAFVVIYVVSLLSEFAGTRYGLPFGSYHYTELLGAKWFGQVPVLIPLSWFLMVLPAYVLAHRWVPAAHRATARIVFAAALFVIWDLSLDPAMSHLTSYWVWEDAGLYYGMPLVNLAGWTITALVLMVLVEAFTGAWIEHLSARWMGAYYGVTLLMPLGMVAAAGQWLAVAATAAALAGVGVLLYRGARKDNGMEGASNSSRIAPGGSEDVVSLPTFVEASASTIFHDHARSFSFAARCFPRKERQLVACLYAFCRTTDDLVDATGDRPQEEIEQQLNVWHRLACRSYAGEASGIAWLDKIMRASARAGVPPDLIDNLVAGVRMDLGPVCIQTVTELDDYAYSVASVVGVWMCYLAGVRDEATLKQAAAMGRAMQLTNVLRDVGEDLEEGRIYLPSAMRVRYGITEAALQQMHASGRVTPAYRRLIEALMARADAEYRRAFPGLVALPPTYGYASAVAAEVYRGIHRQIRQNEYDNLRQRAYTGPLQKTRLALRGIFRLWRHRRIAALKAYYSTIESAGSRWTKHLIQVGRRWLLAVLVSLSAGVAVAGAPGSPCGGEVNAMKMETLHSRYARAVVDDGVLGRTLQAFSDRTGDYVMEEE